MSAPEPEWWEWLADVAADLLADRRQGYPALVQAGRMTQAEADDGIRIMASIAADWRRITALYADEAAEAEDLTASRDEKRATLAAAVERLRQVFQRAYTALPATLPPPMGVETSGLPREGLTMEEMIRLANRRLIAADVLRPAARAWDRLRAAQEMLFREQAEYRPAFWAEATAEARRRDRLPDAA